MSGSVGKGSMGKSLGKKKAESRSRRAGLVFPVGRISRYIRKGNYAKRVGEGAPVYLASILEYLCVEVLELANEQAKVSKKGRLTPRHIQLAIRHDEELSALVGPSTSIASGGTHLVTPTTKYSDDAPEKKKKNTSSKKKAVVKKETSTLETTA